MRLLPFVLVSALPLAAAAAPQRFSSDTHRTHLLELYSSEGCSSCPPAESWLGGLREAPGLWRNFVPVAFHVVYWDNLGWPDRFARKDFTARQYAYASAWHSESVYTPGFVLDGAEWRTAFGRSAPPASSDAAGVLVVDYAEDGTCRVQYAANGDYEIHVALLGGGIVTDVRAGENEGHTLHHEFVALALKEGRLEGGKAELSLARPDDRNIPHRALAAWVTRRGELTPLQATGGWLN